MILISNKYFIPFAKFSTPPPMHRPYFILHDTSSLRASYEYVYNRNTDFNSLVTCRSSGNGDSSSTSPPMPTSHEKPAILLTGFPLEEIPALRQLLDASGGHEICMIPSTPDLLVKPINHVILQSQEPEWHLPMPSTWIDGGGWGQKRVILFHQLDSSDQSAILQIIEDNGITDISPYAINQSHSLLLLGDVFALATKANEALSQLSDELFTDSLPSVEDALGFTAEEIGTMPNRDILNSNNIDNISDSDAIEFDLIDRIAQSNAKEKET